MNTLKLDNTVLVITTGEYYNGRLAVVLDELDGNCFTTVSVNLPEEKEPEPGCFYAKTWGDNEPYREALLASGYFEDTGERVPVNFVVAEVWKLKGCEQPNSARRFLGDGVFVDRHPGGGVVLTTETGLSTTNTIVLEPEVYRALIEYVDNL